MTQTIMESIMEAVAYNAFHQGADERAHEMLAALEPLRDNFALYCAIESAANAYAHRYATDAARLAWEVATDPAALAKLPASPLG